MKTINTVVAAMALSTLSFGVFAAEPVTASQAQNMNKIGVVSADGASTLDALEAKLAEKAAAAGASGYSITSATNNNKLSGTAVIYKEFVGRIRRLRRIRQQMPDATLPRLIRPTKSEPLAGSGVYATFSTSISLSVCRQTHML